MVNDLQPQCCRRALYLSSTREVRRELNGFSGVSLRQRQMQNCPWLSLGMHC